MARIEAGLILLDVDYVGARKAIIPSQKYSPFEIGLGRLVALEPGVVLGQQALKREATDGPVRQLVGLEVDWDDIEWLHDEEGLPPQVAGHGVARVGARLPERLAGGGGHQQHVVADPEEDDRAGHAGVEGVRAGHVAGDGVHRERPPRARRREGAGKLPFFDPPRKRA